MKIEEAAKNWTELGKDDPMWLVLTDETKRGNKWSEEDFFATGRAQIQDVLRQVKDSGLQVNFGAALDFGCGLGRLSQALASHFQHVDGVDISQSLIDQARRFNRFTNKVEYHINIKTDLNLLPKSHFDFILSLIALQHIPSKHQLLYIAAFMEALKPGGVAFFQTVHTRGLRSWVPNWFVERVRQTRSRGKCYIPMYGVPAPHVLRLVEQHGCALQKFSAEDFDNSPSRFGSDTFIVVKRPAKN